MPQGITVKSVLNKTKRRDSWFLDDYTVNMYSGCSFNCLYCYIRGSKYGENIEMKLSYKSNALELLDKQLFLRAKKQQYGIIVLSSATDPYLHFEDDFKLTRGALELIYKYKFPVHIITKSDLVERDFDLLHKIDKESILPNDIRDKLNRKVIVTFSFSTISDTIANIFEPGATLPSKRLNVLQKTSSEDFLTGVSMMPLLPYITDTGQHLEEMYEMFMGVNAQYVMPATITLFGNEKSDSKTLVFNAVKKHYPYLLAKYETLFSNSAQLPNFYTNAFYKKVNELSLKYKMPLRIICANQ